MVTFVNQSVLVQIKTSHESKASVTDQLGEDTIYGN